MADATTPIPPQKSLRRRLFWPGGLSARLLVLTVVFAALGGTVAIPPALAAYEKQWLLDRVRAAELASLAAEVAPDRVVSEQLKTQLLAILVSGREPSCPSCKRQMDDKRRCWACCDRICENGCGRQTGSAFIALCFQCQASASV